MRLHRKYKPLVNRPSSVSVTCREALVTLQRLQSPYPRTSNPEAAIKLTVHPTLGAGTTGPPNPDSLK